MNLSARVEGLADLREQLVGKRRGAATAFKLALAEGVHFWKKEFGPRHFTGTAYSRYGVTPAGYLREARASRAGLTLTYGDITLTPPYSYKELKQARRGSTPDRNPIVFTGLTRAGILQGAFKVRGTSRAVRGSWSDYRINWQALSANGGTLRRSLVAASSSEIDKIRDRVQRIFFPHYLAMVNNKQTLPSISETPQKA